MAVHSAVAYSENLDEPYEAGVEIGEQILQKLPLQAISAGLLFCNIGFDPVELLRGLRTKLHFPLIGGTTGASVNSHGYFDEVASLLVLTGNDLKVGIGLAENLGAEPEAALREACATARAGLGDSAPKLAVILPDGPVALSMSGDLILRQLETCLGNNIPIVGGMVSDNLHFKQTFQFYNEKVYSGAAPLLLLSGDFAPVVVTRSGWCPIGERVKATSTAGNMVQEIDGQPAVEYLQRYIPRLEKDLFLAYPLAILDETLGAEAGAYPSIRVPLMVDERGAIRVSSEIPVNALLQLTRGTREDILNSVREAIGLLQQRAHGRDLQTVLFFACFSRQLILGLDIKKEIETILARLSPNCAVNGFYSYGEIGPFDSGNERLRRNQYHNCSLVLCAL